MYAVCVSASKCHAAEVYVYTTGIWYKYKYDMTNDHKVNLTAIQPKRKLFCVIWICINRLNREHSFIA